MEFLLLPHPPTLADLGYEGFQEELSHYEESRNLYINARNNLDATFANMHQELFSIENTRKKQCTITAESESQDCITPIQELNNKETLH